MASEVTEQLLEDDASEPKPVRQMIVSVGGTFSAVYNLTNVGYALVQLKEQQTVPEWGSSLCSSVALWGSVVGMICLGYVGDVLGRTKAMSLTLSLVVIGALASALLSFGGIDMLMSMLTFWRFLLGVGLGGIFPLSAVANAEVTTNTSPEDGNQSRHRRVAWGMTGMYMAMIVCPLCMFGIEYLVDDSNMAWRIMLGTGAIPALLILVVSLDLKDGDEFKRAQEKVKPEEGESRGVFRALESKENLIGLVAAGGSWFCLDYLWYGISISMPKITKDVFGETSDTSVALTNTALTALAIPGCLISIWAVDPTVLGCRRLQYLSFMYQATCFASLASLYLWAPHETTIIGIVYAAMIFGLMSGCGVTTYILPQALFPPEDRSTLNGLSAALAKVGGAIGVSAYKTLNDEFSVSAAMYGCMASAIGGFLVTIAFVPRHVDDDKVRLPA